MTLKPPQRQLPLRDVNIDDNANSDNGNDDAQSDISIPYSSRTERTTTSTNSDCLTPTSSDARTVAAEGVNLQTSNSVRHGMDSSYHRHEHVDDSLAQWISLYRDEIERQIITNRNRDQASTMRASNTLSAGNLKMHTSQTSETLAGEKEGGEGGGGGVKLDSSERIREKGKGREEESKSSLPQSPSDSSSSTSPTFKKLVCHILIFVALLLAFFAHLRFLSSSPSRSSVDSHPHNADEVHDHEFPPLTILSPVPTATHTRLSTSTPVNESAPSSPHGAQNSNPKPSPPSRYTRYATPLPDQTFILLDSSTGRALTLTDGKLGLAHVPDSELISISDKPDRAVVAVPPCVTKGQCAWYWHCIETSGWLGFRNKASGTFLGHDIGGRKIFATAYKHNEWEWMAVRPAPGEKEGWYLMMQHWWKLHKIQFLKDRREFAMRETRGLQEVEGTVWEFVRA